MGSGPVPNATFLSFPISDRVSLRVNVGSGDALVTTNDITLPEVGSSLTLGLDYNSLLLGSGVANGLDGPGWRLREGADVRLFPASDGSVTFLGEDGTAGKFVKAGSGYTSPPQFHVTLANSSGSTCGGTGYTMTWHATGAVMCFTSAGLITSQADRNGNTNTYSYNGSGQETQVTFTPRGGPGPTQTVTLGYSGPWVDQLSQTSGYLGTREAVYGGDQSSGLLTSDTQPDGTEIQFGYDPANDLTSIENGNNNTTTLTYNSAHQVTSVTQPTTGTSTATTRLAYVSSTETQVADPNTSQSSPVGSVPNTTYTISPATSLVTKAVDPAGDTRSATYNTFNEVLTSQNANGSAGTTTNTYGANSGESLTSSKSPTGATSSLAYGNSSSGTNPTAAFQPSSSTDPQANKTAYTYDGAGNLAQAQNALAAAAKVTYNPDGTPATSTDPKNGGSPGNPTKYSYNSAHELTTITPPTGSSLQPETITYDPAGRVLTVTGGDGNTVTYGYDTDDRIQSAAYTGGPDPVTVTYAFDGAGNLKTQNDSSGTTSYTYDGRNLVLTKNADSGGGTLSYAYDGDMNLTSAQDAGGTTTYSYNTRNLLSSMTDPTGKLWEFAYNADGLRTTTWSATNTAESSWAAKIITSYDLGDRISRIQAYRASSTSNVVSDISYCYTKYASGKSCRTSTATTDTSLVQYSVNNQTGTVSQFTYDTGNRLTKATNVNGSTAYSYGYDSDGNLTTGAPGGSLSFNSANQVTTSGYGYDGAGNLTSDPANGSLSYNDAGQLTSASNANGSGAETLSYAGTGQDQVLSDGSAAGITYGLASQDGQPWVQSYTPAVSSSSAIYVLHDQQGTPLGMVRGGTSYAFVTDNIGSVTAIVDSSGSTGATYTYDPYGTVLSDNGTLAPANLLGYTGALTDISSGNATGYAHDGNRWYNPATGAFTTQDTTSYLSSPANGNRYAYAASNPANYTDPTGQSLLMDVFAGVLSLTAGIIAFDASGGNPYITALAAGCVGGAVGELVSGGTTKDVLGGCVVGAGIGAAAVWTTAG